MFVFGLCLLCILTCVHLLNITWMCIDLYNTLLYRFFFVNATQTKCVPQKVLLQYSLYLCSSTAKKKIYNTKSKSVWNADEAHSSSDNTCSIQHTQRWVFVKKYSLTILNQNKILNAIFNATMFTYVLSFCKTNRFGDFFCKFCYYFFFPLSLKRIDTCFQRTANPIHNYTTIYRWHKLYWKTTDIQLTVEYKLSILHLDDI